MTDFRIDPLLADYDGTVVADLSNAIYLRVMTPLGSYWQNPNLGSLLYTLERKKDVPSAKKLVQTYVQNALQPLLDAGRADSIDIAVDDPQELNGTARMFMRVTVYQSGVVVGSLAQHVPVMQT